MTFDHHYCAIKKLINGESVEDKARVSKTN